jgi:hypothetical protein
MANGYSSAVDVQVRFGRGVSRSTKLTDKSPNDRRRRLPHGRESVAWPLPGGNEHMTKRPLSLTIIAGILVIFSLLALVGAFTMGSNPAMTKMIEQMHVSLRFEQAWIVLGVIIDLIVAYGIIKGQPWSRVLYVVWGIVGLVVGFFISPQKALLVLSLIILVVVSVFLFSEKANDWFSARGFMLKREG